MLLNKKTDGYKSLYLKDYASFVFKNKLEDFVSAYFINIHSSNVPMLQFFSHLSDQQMMATVREGIVKLLTGIENGNAIEDVRENLRQWRLDLIPNIPRDAISLKDITLTYSAQKISFQSFLPYYTADIAVATQVFNEIDLFYKQVQEMALEILDLIRKEEYKKRLESDEKYRDLFDNASDLIHIADADGRILYVNNSWSSTLGYQPSQLKGKHISTFIRPDEAESYNATRKKGIEEKQASIAVRINFIKADGEEITVEGSLSYKYKDGELAYTTALLHDITTTLKQEKQIQFYLDKLADSEKNLRDIIESAPDGVIVIDKDNTIILWNSKSEEIFGWKKEETVGKKMSEMIVPFALREVHSAGMKKFMQTKKANILNRTIEVPALHKSGVEFYISLTVSHSIQNGRDLFIAFLRDISKQKKNEAELENKRKQLERSNKELGSTPG
jgi:PAS domain S-box-containing protein